MLLLNPIYWVVHKVCTDKINSMRNIKRIIGNRIAEERLDQEISQEKLAELANLSKNIIGMIERAETSPSLENIYKIALALNIKMEILFKNL